MLSKTATRVYRGQGELKQSVTESSFDTWTKFYQQGPDAVNNIVSYYTKGSLIALWLDLTIRSKSKGLYSLDTLMRELWIHFGRTGMGTQEDDYINIANILCNEDISEKFKALLYRAERVDLTTLLAEFGVEFQSVKFKLLNGLATIKSKSYIPYIGAQYKDHPLGVKISAVIENSPAAHAGLAVNDILIAVDNLKASVKSLQNLAEHQAEDNPLICHYFRDDQLLSAHLSFIDSPLSAVEITVVDTDKVQAWQSINHQS